MRHGRDVVVQLAEVAFLREILRRIDGLRRAATVPGMSTERTMATQQARRS